MFDLDQLLDQLEENSRRSIDLFEKKLKTDDSELGEQYYQEFLQVHVQYEILEEQLDSVLESGSCQQKERFIRISMIFVEANNQIMLERGKKL